MTYVGGNATGPAEQWKLPTKESRGYGNIVSAIELANLSADDSLPSPSLGIAPVICLRQRCENRNLGSYTEDAGDDTVHSPNSECIRYPVTLMKQTQTHNLADTQ